LTFTIVQGLEKSSKSTVGLCIQALTVSLANKITEQKQKIGGEASAKVEVIIAIMQGVMLSANLAYYVWQVYLLLKPQ
jgi:hypothetical protein